MKGNSKSDDEEPLIRIDSRKPAWRVKFRTIMDKVRAELETELEAEEKAAKSKNDHA